MPDPEYDVTTPAGVVRLLVNDVGAPWVFQDAEIAAFLTLEGGNVKRAAATAIDTNAGNEALASKVLTTNDGRSTDGAKLAQAMHQLADSLRAQALVDEEGAGFVDVVDTVPSLWPFGPELIEAEGWPWV